MRFGTWFWSAWAVIGTLFRLNTWNPRDTMPLLAFVAVAYGPLAFYRWTVSRTKAKEALAKEEFLKVAGAPKFSHFEGETAIALDSSAGKVTLRVGKDLKIYSFTDVREWTNALATPGTIVPMGGLTNGLVAGFAQMGAAQRAAAQTGFFVKVRDVDHPEWRVSMFKKSDRDRWSEIFEQEINERRASPA